MNHLEAFHEIHTFFFDVDGVITDSTMLVMENGKVFRRMNNRDVLAIKTAIGADYRIVIISSSKSEGIKDQLALLGVTDFYLGVEDKLEAYEEVVHMYDLDEEGVLYMGDDWPDYQSMRRAGMAVCPKDAIPEIIKISKYISPLKGGEACVRDVIEKVLRLNDDWMTP